VYTVLYCIKWTENKDSLYSLTEALTRDRNRELRLGVLLSAVLLRRSNALLEALANGALGDTCCCIRALTDTIEELCALHQIFEAS
jgi:hypothetical protein